MNELQHAKRAQILSLIVEGSSMRSISRVADPADCTGIKKNRIEGSSDLAPVSTPYVERQNLTMRIGMRRFTCPTNGFSKRVESHRHMLALVYVHYDFIWMHKTIRCSPAMAVGVSRTLWTADDVLALIDARAEPAKPRLHIRRDVQTETLSPRRP